MPPAPKCQIVKAGTMQYMKAWELQRSLVDCVQQGEQPNTLLLLQHPSVYTIGRRGRRDDVLLDEVMITHNYYDRRSVVRDLNVVFPLDRLTELAGEGRIAGRSPLHLGFMGHIDGPMVDKLIKKTAPVAARLLVEVGTDCVLLTPA